MHAMHMDQLDLNLLMVFDAIYQEGSVTKAAHKLGLTQSAMSHSLNRLRAYFDDPLFVKIGPRMEPTSKAAGMCEAVTDVVSTVRNRIVMSAGFNPTKARRVFTLNVTDMGELVFLPALLARFKKIAPECSLRTLQAPIEQIDGLLASGEIDLALGSIRAAPEGLYQQRLFPSTFVIMASTRNKELGDTLSREQFESMQHIVVSLTGRTSESYDKVLEEQGLHRRIAVVTPHFLMVPLLIDRHPDLLATVPRELAEVFGRFGVVRHFEPPLPVPPFQLSQYWHARFHSDPAIVWLRELVKDTFKSYPDVAV